MLKACHLPFYSGISGLKLDIPKYLFPEQYKNASRLAYYSSLFNSIEINSSFYKVPMASTVNKWAESVNEKFKFTFKVWKEVTHAKGFEFAKPDAELFLKSVAATGNKKGCLLIQLPPSSSIKKITQLSELLKCICVNDEQREWNIAVEFRNRSWYDKEVYELLDFYKAAIVIHDIPKSSTPMIDHTSNFIYVRFHGPTGNYRGSYSEQFLSEYAGYVNEWLGEGKTVYAYFNNTMGDAFNNLKTFNALINAEN
jgi:uncharacterized protein YecE (DUF72 family)